MNKKLRKVIGILICWLGCAAAHGQSQLSSSSASVALPCGNSAPSAAQVQDIIRTVIPLENRLMQQRPATGAMVYLPIKLYMVRRTDGSGGMDMAEFYKGLAATNEQFAAASIQFYLTGPVAYIDNTQYYDFSSVDETAITSNHDLPNVINLYLTHAATLQGGAVGGYCSSRIFLIYSHANIQRSLSHELGHFFGLIHTFNNSNSATISDRELAQGGNCQTTGDLICDTPGDPSERPGATITECAYTGTITDAQGNPYTPLVRNVMAFQFCGNQFTPGQIARMEATRLARLTNLTWAGAQPAAPTGLTATVSAVGIAQMQQVRLQWQAATGTVGYFIERASAGNPDFVAIGAVDAAATTFTDLAAPANQAVSYRLKPINATASFSNSVTVASALSYPKPVYVNTDCTPGSMYDISVSYLEEVQLNQGAVSLIRSIGISCGSYNQTTGVLPILAPGATYSGTLKSKIGIDPVTGGGFYDQQYTAIWVDYNRNGSFADAGELVFNAPTAAANTNLPVTQPFTFTVPTTTAGGITRMRIRSQQRAADGRVWDPAARAWAGAVNDYSILLQGPGTATRLAALDAAIQVYPNPVADELLLDVPANITWQRSALFDVQGRQVISNSSADGHPRVMSVCNLRPGIYILAVSTAQGTVYKRVVKE